MYCNLSRLHHKYFIFSFLHFLTSLKIFPSLCFVRSLRNFIRRLSMLWRYLFSFCLFKAKYLLTKKIQIQKPWKMIWRWANEMATNAVEILISHCPRFMVHSSFQILLEIAIQHSLWVSINLWIFKKHCHTWRTHQCEFKTETYHHKQTRV